MQCMWVYAGSGAGQLFAGSPGGGFWPPQPTLPTSPPSWTVLLSGLGPGSCSGDPSPAVDARAAPLALRCCPQLPGSSGPPVMSTAMAPPPKPGLAGVQRALLSCHARATALAFGGWGAAGKACDGAGRREGPTARQEMPGGGRLCPASAPRERLDALQGSDRARWMPGVRGLQPSGHCAAPSRDGRAGAALRGHGRAGVPRAPLTAVRAVGSGSGPASRLSA